MGPRPVRIEADRLFGRVDGLRVPAQLAQRLAGDEMRVGAVGCQDGRLPCGA